MTISLGKRSIIVKMKFTRARIQMLYHESTITVLKPLFLELLFEKLI